MNEYVCADCGVETNEQNGPCKNCNGMRIASIAFVEEQFGPNWRDAFKKISVDEYDEMELFAWIGEDELGSGEVGIKAGFVPAGCVPLVAKDLHKMIPLKDQMQAQANGYGKTIRLCRYQFVEEIVTVEPQRSDDENRMPHDPL